MAALIEARPTERTTRNPLKVGLAVLMAGETVWTVAFAVAKFGADLSVGSLTGVSDPRLVLPVALASDAVVAVPICFVTVVATVALWQDGWGRARLIGPRKREAVWSALMLQVVLLVWSFLPQTDIVVKASATEARLVGLLAGVAAGIGWVVMKPPYAGIRRRVVLILACMFTAVGVIGIFSLRYTAEATIRSLRQTMEEVFRPSVPEDAIICKGSVSLACAQEAADRVGHPVAWVPLPPSPELLLAAIDRADYAFEYAYAADEFSGLSLDSPPQTHAEGEVVRTVVANGIRAEVRKTAYNDYAGSAQIDWEYQGQRYEISSFMFFRPLIPADVDALVDLWHEVRYVQPR